MYLHVDEHSTLSYDAISAPDIVLVTFAVDDERTFHNEKAETIALGLKMQELLARKDKVILVGTKYDLVRRDLNNLDLLVRGIRTSVAYFHDLQFCAVSSLTGEGMDDLKSILCKFNTFISSDGSKQLSVTTIFPRSPPGPGVFDFFRSIMDKMLDAVVYTFRLPAPPDVNKEVGAFFATFNQQKLNCSQQTPDPDWKLDPEELNMQLQAERRFGRRQDDYGKTFGRPDNPLHYIRQSVIAKYPSEWERQNMVFVRKNTTIPVPQPRFHFVKPWLLMDRIDGCSLDQCWGTLNPFMQFRVACTLRLYLKQLRRLTSTVPGHDGIIAGEPFAGSEHGPVEDANCLRLFCEMVAHTGWRHRVRYHRDRFGDSDPPVTGVGEPWPLVFVHADLHPGNIILSKDNVLWLIDWAHSAFLPPWIVSVYLNVIAERQPPSWNRWKHFIAGNFPQYDYLWKMAFVHFKLVSSERITC